MYPKLLFLIAASVIFSCPFYFHPNCIRTLHGNVINETSLPLSQITLLIREENIDTNWLYPTTATLNAKGEFSIDQFYIQAEIECTEGCSENWSIPQGIQVRALNTGDKTILLDTTYHCEHYLLEPNAIRLKDIRIGR